MAINYSPGKRVLRDAVLDAAAPAVSAVVPMVGEEIYRDFFCFTAETIVLHLRFFP